MSKQSLRVIQALIVGFMFLFGGALSLYAQETATEEFTLEEITVTAEKRSENLQDVPISMTVVQGTEVINKSMESIHELLKEIPNVVTTAMGQGFTITMRGLGQDLPPGMGEASVAQNIDGAHQSNLQSVLFGFFDVDRVEVLRGPQGTLYGRNAVGGVVNIISTKPKPDVVEGYAVLNVGDYNVLKGEGAINVPISDSWAGRLGFLASKTDGYTKDVGGGRATQWGLGTRVQLRYQPSDDISVNFMANYTQKTGTRLQDMITIDNWNAGKRDINNSTYPWDRLAQSTSRIYKLQINAEFPAGPGVVTFIPTYDHVSSRSASLALDRRTGELTDPPAFNEGGVVGNEISTAELRYASRSDARIVWVGGLYYQTTDSPGRSQDPLPRQLDYSKAYAAFGQITYPFSDTFRGIVGARVNKDKKGYENNFRMAPYPTSASYSFTYFDWKLCVEKDFGENIMHYLTLATGHRPGGYNGWWSGVPFDEESLISMEWGMKTRFMDERLQVNGDIFYYDYKGYQAVDVWMEWDEDEGRDVIRNIFYNVDKAMVLGSEIETSILLGDTTVLDVSATYLKNEYKSDFYVHENVMDPFPVNQKGMPFPQSPEFTFSASVEHTFRFNSGASLMPRVSYRWTDERYMEVFISPEALWPSYSVVDASLIYYSTRNWTFNFYANNALDKDYATAVRSNDGYFKAAPRTIGCIFNMRF